MFKNATPVSDQDEINAFLDDLREGGKVNMFAAPPLLQEMFDIPRKEARQAFAYWANHFGSAETR